jgi:hypothetical protein
MLAELALFLVHLAFKLSYREQSLILISYKLAKLYLPESNSGI